MLSVYDVADFFVQALDGKSMNVTKLNKLLYFAQGYHLAQTGDPIFGEEIVAWQHGPVVRSIYDEYKYYKGHTIPAKNRDLMSVFKSEEYDFLLDVAREYGDYSATELVNLTHGRGEPWDKTDEGNIISSEEIKNHFLRQHELVSFNKIVDNTLTPTIGYTNTDGILVLPAEYDNGDDWSSTHEVD